MIDAAAIDRAKERAARAGLEGQVRFLRQVGPTAVYAVPSSQAGQPDYTVTETRGTYACNCVAGQHNRPCRHGAAVAMSQRRRPVERPSVAPRRPPQPAGEPVDPLPEWLRDDWAVVERVKRVEQISRLFAR